MNRSLWQYFDWSVLFIAVVLTALGVAMIYSATLEHEPLADAWRNQALYGAIGLTLMLVVSRIDYRLLESLQWPLYLLVLGLLIFTLLLGRSEIADVRRFIYVGGVSVQPAFPAPDATAFFLSLGLTGLAAFLVYQQPNLSTATLYTAVWGAMLFTSGMNLSYVGGLVIGMVAAFPMVLPRLPEYMQDRIRNFLDPTRDPWAQYNIEQALISIGSGGFWGKGFAAGTQSQLHFLRVRHTDFIFSVICEELGFAGALVVLALFGLLLWRLLRVAARAADLTGQLIVVGVITYIFYQLIVNIGMNLNLVPVAGLPLPFISSGGTSLVIAYVGLGLVESVAMRRRRLEF